MSSWTKSTLDSLSPLIMLSSLNFTTQKLDKDLNLLSKLTVECKNNKTSLVCLLPERPFTSIKYFHLRASTIIAPRKVADFRPIALCTAHYKIIAKILTMRLQPLLPRIISPHQSAFVPKRAIEDNVLITHEILHYLRTSKAKVRHMIGSSGLF